VQFSTVIDNHESLQSIGVAACSAGVRVSLLLDLNVGMDRTGIEVGESAMELYRDLCNTPGIVAAGLHAYDGHLHDADLALLQQQSEQTFAPVLWMRKELIASGCSVPRIVAAGTPTTRFLCRYPDVEVGAGTTVLWDFGQTVISPDLQFLHAAVLLARVVSRPTANRLCIDLGHKAVASEMSHPRVRFFGLEDAATVMHSEEHLVLETSRAAHYPVGTVLYGLPRHVCPTVALQSDVGVVEDRVYVTTWPVVARTRCLTI
jgi:D-serine deaminase-like pyridoxal phosphate-dependent protein